MFLLAVAFLSGHHEYMVGLKGAVVDISIGQIAESGMKARLQKEKAATIAWWLDGRVVSGSLVVDEASITGEPIPVVKEKGVQAFAGTVNQRGLLEIEVTRLSEDTTLARVIHSVGKWSVD